MSLRWALTLGLVNLLLISWTWAASREHDLVLNLDGMVVIDGQTKIKVQAGIDLDSLTWVAIDKPGTNIEGFKATLHLPKLPTDQNQISHKILAIKGVGSSASRFIDNQTIEYSAQSIGPNATVSVIANFPKGYLNLPATTKAGIAIQKLNKFWVATSIVIPLLGLLVLLYMYLARLIDHRIDKHEKVLSTPPSDISPALTSILYENKIQPEAIAAALIDLANRGFISIFNKGNNFIFAREKEIDLSTSSFQLGLHQVQLDRQELEIAKQEGLQPFEKILLSKLFVSARPISSKEDVRVRIGHGLFSKKVAAIYEYLFISASDLGFFVPHAARVHRKFLMVGWLLGIVGFVGFLLGVWQLPDPKYFLLFWAALVFLSFLIIRLAPYVPLRTQAGRRELSKFLSFREFLVEDKPAPKEIGMDEFYQYLGYAWSLRAHHQWAKRFAKAIFHRPDWYYTSKKINSSEEFIEDIDNMIDFVAESFAAVREKTLV